MQSLQLYFPGEPKAIQSVRFVRRGEGDDQFVATYQPKKNIEWKNYIRLTGNRQLPSGFRVIRGPVKVDVVFLFPVPKSWPQYKRREMENGYIFYKTTRPDLNDNLMKGLIDALTELVWLDDSQIVRVTSEKIYGTEPGIKIKIYELPEFRAAPPRNTMEK
jgi:Holliday junction resolvase RusA-like endonuclease